MLCLRINGLPVAVLACLLLTAAPGFLELASSCMVEVPSLAPVVAAFAILLLARPSRWPWAEIGAGILFGVALQMKVIAVIYLPLAVLIVWLRSLVVCTFILSLGSALRADTPAPSGKPAETKKDEKKD